MRTIGRLTVEVKRKGKIIEKFSYPIREMDCKPENRLMDFTFPKPIKADKATKVIMHYEFKK